MGVLKHVIKSATTLSFVVLGLVGSASAFAATSPTLTGSATYSVLGATTVTNTVTATTTTGDVGVSTGTSITNFPPGIAGGNNITHLHSNDASAIAAQADNLSAYGTLDQGCTVDYGGVTKELGGLSLPAGVYCATAFQITGHLTLTGAGVWIFKSASTLNTATDSSVTGGDPCSIWWRVASSATIGVRSAMEGSILALTSVGLATDATLNGRAMAQTAAVALDHNVISGPTCTSPTPTAHSAAQPAGTINVVKTVINDNGGTMTVSDFPLFVNGVQVVSGVTNTFFPAAAYDVTETSDTTKYARSFSGDCDLAGRMSLNAGENKFCIITNNDIGAPAVVPVVPPLIDVVKVPSPLALPNGPGPVTYTYTVRNVGTVPMTNVTMVGDTCSPITLVSGDVNNDAVLQTNETWKYTCSTTLQETHTNTVVATGWANGLSATDIASATVVVGVPLVPPLIHVTKVPSPLVLRSGGGWVTYTEKVTNPGTVALNNVKLVDDKCSPMKMVSGDANGDGKLDVNETWTYTCRSNLSETTTNTAIATGEANGFTVRDIALATVVVAAVVPPLPKTGFAPADRALALGLAATGLLAVSLALYALKKKQVA